MTTIRELLSRLRRRNSDAQFIRASEVNRIIKQHVVYGKTNVFLIGANIISDCAVYLDSEKYNVVVAHCKFIGEY